MTNVIKCEENLPTTYRDMGNGTYAKVIAAVSSGAVESALPNTEEQAQIVEQWGNFAGVNTANGDFVVNVSGLNGQAIVALSGSPLTTGESYATNTNRAVKQPASMEIAGSFVRTGISFATVALFANGPNGPDPVPENINIVDVSQSNAVQGADYSAVAGTILRITLASALPFVGSRNAVFAGDWINITGLVDSRLNYANACINYISPDRTVITCGFSDEAALPSLAVATITPTLGTAQVNFYNNMSGARNGFGLRMTGTTATSAAVVSIFGGDDNQVSGTLLGDHRVTIGTTAPTYVAGGNWGQSEIRASTRFMFECTPSASILLDKSEQTQVAWTARDIPRTSVKPNSEALLYPRFRLYKPVSMSRPVAKILNITKAGSTTWTVTHDGAFNFLTGHYVMIKGSRDVINFAPISTPTIITVLTPTTFTLVSTTGTATGYGGSVILANGGRDQPGIIGQTVSAVASRVAVGVNWLNVTGNTTWSGINVGDYVQLHGVRTDLTGADLGLDGAWEVANLAASVMTLLPVFDIFGSRVSPALGTLASTNAGGTVILRPTVRSHDLSIRYWAETNVTIEGQGTTRLDKAHPVNVVNQITAAISGNPVLGTGANTIGAVNIAANQTLTAVTTAGTPAAPTNTFVNSAASTNGQLVITGTTGVQAVYCTNTGATAAYVKLYNKATAPTVGTDAPEMIVPIPAAVAGVPGAVNVSPGFNGQRFPLGLGLAITGGAVDSDTTAVAAAQVKVKIARTV